MKNIILLGASRAGKSSLTKLLNKEFDNIMIMRTDLLRLAFREAICKDINIKMSSFKDNNDYRNYIVSYYKYANMYEKDFLKIVDTVDFEPKDYKYFENSIMICLGYPNISKEEVLVNWRKYDTESDWTKNKDDDILLSFAEKEICNSKYLKEECEKYDVKYVDTSSDREKVLNDLVEYIKKNI